MAKAVAFMLVITIMVSTFTVRANALDAVGSGRSLLRLKFFTNYAQGRGLTSSIEEVAAPAPSAEAPNGDKKGQTWVSWFEQKMGSVSSMFGGSSSKKASAPTTSA